MPQEDICLTMKTTLNMFKFLMVRLWLIVQPLWEYSTDFERDHKSLGLITEALGMSENEVDEFFRIASTL